MIDRPFELAAVPEQTPTENPFAKMIKGAVTEAFESQRGWLTKMERRIIDAISGVAEDIATVKLTQKAQEARQNAFEERLSRLEAEREARHTEPAPPPTD